MKDQISKLLILFFVINHSFSCLAQSSRFQIVIDNDSSTYWYAGVVNHGYKMPIQSKYEVDLYGNNFNNQIQPLILSNKGDVLWCDDPIKIKITSDQVIIVSHGKNPIQQAKNGNTLKEAYEYAAENYFSCQGQMPDSMLFTEPQYNTWIELMYDQNQADIQKYADGIIENNFPAGVIMIDDNWQEDYGKWNFHQGRFPNPKKMISQLHQQGFKVMMWICPFVSPDCDVYRELESKDLLLKNKSGQAKMIRWWNGVSALLDFTNPKAVEWFKSQLNILAIEYGVDGFKFDAGDSRFYQEVYGYKNVSPNEHSRLFAKIGLDYPLNEYRANWKMGGEPLANRLADKGHTWEAIRTLIPNMITAGLMGYSYTCPDMIGGGSFTSFLPGVEIDQELIVRSAQCHALMPMMQFSVAPWRILEPDYLNAVQNSISIRNKNLKYIMEAVEDARVNCTPIIRSMEYSFPHNGYENIKDQFLIGEKLLVAPILVKNCKSREIIIPEGNWKGYNNKNYTGPIKIELEIGISDIPHFIKQ